MKTLWKLAGLVLLLALAAFGYVELSTEDGGQAPAPATSALSQSTSGKSSGTSASSATSRQSSMPALTRT